MNQAHIAIVGGGASGLYAAWLLARHGFHDYVLLEARDRLGGRILSPDHLPDTAGAHASQRFDLGPSWFWPAYQPQLDRLVNALGLRRFPQFEDGDMLVETDAESPVLRRPGFANVPPAMRLTGGMASLVDALAAGVDPGRLHTGHAVRALRLEGDRVLLDVNAAGATAEWHVEQVLLALPPRIAAETLVITPALPEMLSAQWRATDTWMAPHAKYVAVYDRPFWRDDGLSGEARSMAGPLGEIHDASIPGGMAALFGFLHLPAVERGALSEAALQARCRRQLGHLFGPQAAAPAAEFLQDWAREPRTSTLADLHAGQHHGRPPAAAPAAGPWNGRITGICSEWSVNYPGYLAGAIEAAHAGCTSLLNGIGSVAG